jgi:hypothetical protein
MKNGVKKIYKDMYVRFPKRFSPFNDSQLETQNERILFFNCFKSAATKALLFFCPVWLPLNGRGWGGNNCATLSWLVQKGAVTWLVCIDSYNSKTKK